MAGEKPRAATEQVIRPQIYLEWCLFVPNEAALILRFEKSLHQQQRAARNQTYAQEYSQREGFF